MLLNDTAQPGQLRTRGPGWTEILVGLAVMALAMFGVPLLMRASGVSQDWSDVTIGLFLAALSGLAGLIAFAAAARVRNLRWSDFGVRRTTRRWLLNGLGAGLMAFVLSRVISSIVYQLSGPTENVQQPFADAVGDQILTAALSLLFLAVLTPIGEEFLFRGVLTTALLRYGPAVAVVASSVVFALLHGLNIVFWTALVVGLVAGEVRRRSGSIWPAVLVHVTNNFIAQSIVVAIALWS